MVGGVVVTLLVTGAFHKVSTSRTPSVLDSFPSIVTDRVMRPHFGTCGSAVDWPRSSHPSRLVGRAVTRNRLVVPPPVGAPVLLHLGLEQVPPPTDEPVASQRLEPLERLVV